VDPLWALLAEGWWAVPVAAGAVGTGALGWLGVRAQRRARVRRLEVDAAQHDVRAAHQAIGRARAGVMAARAEVARADADRLASRATAGDVASSRRRLAQAQQDLRASVAALRARRAAVRAARASVPSARDGADALPLARLMTSHDRVTARWMEYETDAAKVLEYPWMSDAQAPLTAEFLRAQSAAQWLRPASPDARISAADYAAYRDAVRRAVATFEAAERDALARAGHLPPEQNPSDRWASLAQEFVEGAQRTVARSAEAAARAAAEWTKRRPPKP
jgi:hypothetical protein